MWAPHRSRARLRAGNYHRDDLDLVRDIWAVSESVRNFVWEVLKTLSCLCGSQSRIQLAYLTDDAVGDSVPDVVVRVADTIDDPTDEGIGALFRTENEPAGRVCKDKMLFFNPTPTV